MAEKGASVGERIAAVAAALDVAAIGDERLGQGLVLLLNLVEELAAEDTRLRQGNPGPPGEPARAQVSGPKVLGVLGGMGGGVGRGELSGRLVGRGERVAAERAVVAAGLGSSPWQQTDHTPQRVNGTNQHCQVLSSPVYTAYATT